MRYLLPLLFATSIHAQSLPTSEPTSAPTSLPLQEATRTIDTPGNPAHAEALLMDIKHLVKVTQSAGWKIDTYEIDKLMPDALQSVCLVDVASRRDAEALLADEITASGGPLELLYQKNPKIKKLRSELSLYRSQLLLTEANQRAARDCPFYLQPQRDFQSLQGTDNRFLFVVESEGSAQIEKKGDQLSYGGGGFGRLLFGKGFDKTSILAGVELAGSGLLPLGSPASEFEVRYYANLPLVVRWTNINWQYEAETALVTMFDETNFNPSVGVRGAVGLGVHSHRRQGFIPWGSLSLGLDHFFEGIRPTTNLIHAGFRAGFTFN